LLLNNLLFFSPKFQTKEMMNHAGTQSGWSPDGSFISASTLGGTETESPYTLDIASDGHVMLTGRFIGPTDFDPGEGKYFLSGYGYYDAFILKLTPDGLWF
jgi:hypothetical protein